MSEEEFVDLMLELQVEASPMNVQRLINHAMELRQLVRQFIREADQWDVEWPELGYVPGFRRQLNFSAARFLGSNLSGIVLACLFLCFQYQMQGMYGCRVGLVDLYQHRYKLYNPTYYTYYTLKTIIYNIYYMLGDVEYSVEYVESEKRSKMEYILTLIFVLVFLYSFGLVLFKIFQRFFQRNS